MQRGLCVAWLVVLHLNCAHLVRDDEAASGLDDTARALLARKATLHDEHSQLHTKDDATVGEEQRVAILKSQVDLQRRVQMQQESAPSGSRLVVQRDFQAGGPVQTSGTDTQLHNLPDPDTAGAESAVRSAQLSRHASQLQAAGQQLDEQLKRGANFKSQQEFGERVRDTLAAHQDMGTAQKLAFDAEQAQKHLEHQWNTSIAQHETTRRIQEFNAQARENQTKADAESRQRDLEHYQNVSAQYNQSLDNNVAAQDAWAHTYGTYMKEVRQSNSQAIQQTAMDGTFGDPDELGVPDGYPSQDSAGLGEIGWPAGYPRPAGDASKTL